MTTPTLTDKVRQALQSLKLDGATIDVESAAPSIFATVTSRAFNGVEEAERQRRVWQVLRESLDESERQAVEFVFTESPDDPIEAGAEESHP
jgi:acid stress-induced BolA-like protein IbaG/YrbA